MKSQWWEDFGSRLVHMDMLYIGTTAQDSASHLPYTPHNPNALFLRSDKQINLPKDIYEL